ncbi:MAG: hypothetical protein HY675_16725 [Chloroflexi bacterium]|nr:hypothetical protein [Chloroflexota bacterium]
MSEYQYYEFLAIDRPLSQSEMAELRRLSSRATITSTRLQNVYNWGNFRGDPDVLMEKYFDVFLYLANWGTHQFMVRLPGQLLAPETATLYSRGESASTRATSTHTILEFISDDEEGGGWVEDSEGSDWLSSLVPLRGDIASGDLRCLYLGWLLCAQNGDLDDDEVEPPVPPGLGKLSAALDAFADFMRIDEDLIAVAAQRSLDRIEIEPSSGELRRWIRDLAVSEKEAFLLRLVEGHDVHLRSELLQRFRQERTSPAATSKGAVERRRVAELLAAAERYGEARRREEAERAAVEQARRKREEAEARAKYLDTLVGRDEEIWSRVKVLIEVKKAAEYDQAVQYLKDLRDLAGRGGRIDQFSTRLAELRALNPGKQALLRRLDEAGL